MRRRETARYAVFRYSNYGYRPARNGAGGARGNARTPTSCEQEIVRAARTEGHRGVASPEQKTASSRRTAATPAGAGLGPRRATRPPARSAPSGRHADISRSATCIPRSCRPISRPPSAIRTWCGPTFVRLSHRARLDPRRRRRHLLARRRRSPDIPVIRILPSAEQITRASCCSTTRPTRCRSATWWASTSGSAWRACRRVAGLGDGSGEQRILCAHSLVRGVLDHHDRGRGLHLLLRARAAGRGRAVAAAPLVPARVVVSAIGGVRHDRRGVLHAADVGRAAIRFRRRRARERFAGRRRTGFSG